MSIEKAIKDLKKAKAYVKAETKKRDVMLKKYTKRIAKSTHEAMTQEKDQVENSYSAALNKFEAAKKAVFATVEKRVANIESTLVAEKKSMATKVEKAKKNAEGKVQKGVKVINGKKK
jgi:hypothetical protein